ncbi:gamma-glutamylcyclotransferase [Roseicyclus sp.]|uniref:gamma-glutamylcyclotransferase n=1 Tax=Roseicyclus sp. TaxID=1914329 RepID=UPI003F6CB798
MQDLWVFGYGSLLWNPGFAVAETRQARLHGWRRSFCMTSIHHRGTPEAPGLVLALDRAADGVCHGVAFRVADGAADATLAYLRERELVSSAYLETRQSVTLDCGATLEDVLTYVIDPQHDQYCTWPLETQAQIIAHAMGGRGPNDEYLENTARQLHLLGLPDPDLDWLVARVREIKTG